MNSSITLSFFLKLLSVCFFSVWLISCDHRNKDDLFTKAEASIEVKSRKNSSPTAVSLKTDTKKKENISHTLVSSNTTQRPKNSVSPSVASLEANPTITQTQTEDDSLKIKKPSKFPQHIGKKWNISREDITNLFEENGSDLSQYYIQYWFNNIESVMKYAAQDPQYKKKWDQFCHNSDCSKGLDLKRIDKSKIKMAIDLLASIPMLIVSDEKNPSTEAIFLLQGLLAPEGLKIQYSNHPNVDYQNTGEHPTHSEKILQMVNDMKQKNIKRIVVNLDIQNHTDPRPFFLLGNFIKRNQVDLHIVGRCEIYCAKYLIPSAKTVYIEPYGYIYFDGSFSALSEEFEKALTAHMTEYIKSVQKENPLLSEKKGKISFISSWIKNTINSDNYSDFIKKIKRGAFEKAEEFEEVLINWYYAPQTPQNLVDFSETQRVQFLQSLSSEMLNELTTFVHLNNNPNLAEGSHYTYEVLFYLTKLESIYYNQVNIETLTSTQGYTFIDLLQLAARLIQIPEYEKYFSLPRDYYNIPEQDKPYLLVFPATELLISLGIDVRGENNIKIVGSEKDSKRINLYLDNKRIKNCKFFEGGAPYITQALYDCLFE